MWKRIKSLILGSKQTKGEDVMAEQISITIPMRREVIEHAIVYLEGLVNILVVDSDEVKEGMRQRQIDALNKKIEASNAADLGDLDGAPTGLPFVPPNDNDISVGVIPPGPIPPIPPVDTMLKGESPDAPLDLDSAGYPWDARIHSGSHKRVEKTDEWKRKRGVAGKLVKDVQKAFDALRVAAPAPVELPTDKVPPVPPAFVPLAANPVSSVAPPAPLAAPLTPAPVSEDDEDEGTGIPGFEAPPPITYLSVMQECSKRIKGGTMTIEQLEAICRESGLAEPSELNAHRDLIPAVHARLEELWVSQGTLG